MGARREGLSVGLLVGGGLAAMTALFEVIGEPVALGILAGTCFIAAAGVHVGPQLISWHGQRTARRRSDLQRQREREEYTPELRLWDRFYVAVCTLMELYFSIEGAQAPLEDYRMRLEDLLVTAEEAAGDPLLPNQAAYLRELTRIREVTAEAEGALPDLVWV